MSWGTADHAADLEEDTPGVAPGTAGPLPARTPAARTTPDTDPHPDEATTPETAPPSISVVMPVYNGAATIAESINSVLAQTVPVLEIVVVDDGSTDETIAILSRYRDRVRVIRQNRAGNAGARNRGVLEARGDWIAVLDADDLWRPDKLEKQIVHCDSADVIYAANRNFGDCSRVGELRSIDPYCAPHDPLRILMVENFITHSTVLVRRDSILAVGNYDDSLRSACDWDLWLRLAHAGVRFRGVPEPLVDYRWISGTTSRRNHHQNALNRLRVVKRAIERSGLSRIGLHTLRRALHNVCCTSAWFAAADRPYFALRWYLLAQVFRPNDLAVWREIASLVLRPLLDPVRALREAHEGDTDHSGHGLS